MNVWQNRVEFTRVSSDIVLWTEVGILYFRGIPPGGGTIQSLWAHEVKKAAAKYRKVSPLPAVGQDPEARTIEAIRSKLKSGKKLSPAELDFLRKRAPELYAKAVRVAQERDAYEASLRASRSKAEAEGKQNRMLARVANLIKHCDPEEAEMLVNAVKEVNLDYKRSDEYARLKEDED